MSLSINGPSANLANKKVRRVYPSLVTGQEQNQHLKRRSLWVLPHFWIAFALPNVFSVAYFGFIASPIYVSHASLEVSKPGKSQDSIAGLLSGGTDASGGGAYVVQDFAATPDEFEKINSQYNLGKIYRSYDFLGRFGSVGSWFSTSDFALWKAYQNSVKVSVSKSGLAQITVDGPTANIAQSIAAMILSDTVNHIRELNERENSDYDRAARKQVDALERALQADDKALRDFRISSGVYSPDAYYTSLIGQNTQLTLRKLDASSKIAGLVTATPNSAASQAYRAESDIIDRNIAQVNSDLKSVNSTSAAYVSLQTRHETDAKLLSEARVALLQSDVKASQDHYYIHEIGQPSHLHGSERPHRMLMIFIVFIITSGLIALIRPVK